MVNSCTVCMNNSRKTENLSYFAYPLDPKRRQQWLEIVGRTDLAEKLNNVKLRYGYRICEAHFEKHFIRTSKRNFKCLFDSAFPSLNIHCKENQVSSESSSAIVYNMNEHEETDETLPSFLNVNIKCEDLFEEDIDISAYDEKAGSEQNLQDFKSIVQNDDNGVTKKEFLGLCDTLLNKGMSQLIKWQDFYEQGNEGQSEAFKFFALNLYYTSPEAYQFFRSTFGLPSFDMLQYSVIPKSTKVNPKLLWVLRMKVEKMSLQEKICSVCVECRPVRQNLFYDIRNDRVIGFHDIKGTQKAEPAKYVTVIIVRGIIHKWKQPIAHSFLSHCANYTEVTAWIDDVLFELLNIGLDIRTFVTNLDFQFANPSVSDAINVDKTFFELMGRKIYYIFDVPNLINCLVNIFQTCDFMCDIKIAKWSHIIEMHEQNIKNELKLLCKRKKRSKRNRFYLTRVDLATEVFSDVIGLAIKKCVEMNVLDTVSLDTADFVMKMSLLYQILNSNAPQLFTKDDSRIKFLKEMISLFENMVVVKSDTCENLTEPMNFITGFRITLKTVLQLIEDFQLENIPNLYTKRLTLNVVEKFFNNIADENVAHQEPTCRQVTNAFKKSFANNLLRKLEVPNCNEDFISLVTKRENGSNFFDSFSEAAYEERDVLIEVGTDNYRFDLPENNALVYVSVYLFRQCLAKHKCEHLSRSINQLGQTNEDTFKSDVLIVPPIGFITIIRLLDKTFCDYFATQLEIRNVGNEILELLKDNYLELPCPCFPINYLKKLFVRFKIYHTLKRNNKLLKNSITHGSLFNFIVIPL